MAYGSFNAGGGAAVYDLNKLAAGIISGHVNAPLTTVNETVIATVDGVQIMAHTVRQGQSRDESVVTSAIAGIVRMIDEMNGNIAATNAEILNLKADIIRGIVSVPMMTAGGDTLHLDDGVELCAYKVMEGWKPEIMAYIEILEQQHTQNLTAIQALSTSLESAIAVGEAEQRTEENS